VAVVGSGASLAPSFFAAASSSAILYTSAYVLNWPKKLISVTFNPVVDTVAVLALPSWSKSEYFSPDLLPEYTVVFPF